MLLRLLPVLLLSVFGHGLTAASTASASAADWATYEGNNGRTGVVAGAPAFHGFSRRFTRPLDGQLYAQPLIVAGTFYAATENNSVYAIRGDGRVLWRRHFGAPVPGGDLPCGNIDPSGITGTPAIVGGRLFVVAFLAAGHRHVLYSLDLAHQGRVSFSRSVDPPNRLVHQQRGALLVAHGRVYVPFGGLYGDCGPYHGRVVSWTTRGGARRDYANPSSEAGIWAPGGLSEEAGGNLLAATGNAAPGAGGFAYAQSVLRLSPNLRRLAHWAPSNWISLSDADTDIGSVTPTPLPQGRVFQSGKNGVGYVLFSGLGGVGHEAFARHICDAAFGTPAVAGSLIIVPCTDSLVALRLSGLRFSIAWRSGGQAGTPIIAGGAVLTIDSGGVMRALRLSDGHQLSQVSIGGGASSFPAPAASGTLLAAGAGRRLVAFGL